MTMKRLAWAILTVALCICAARAAEKPTEDDIPLAPDGVKYLNRDSYEAMQLKPIKPDVLRNGSFEAGRYWPYAWDPCDQLGTHWVEGGTNGRKCIRVDTNLLESQWLPWNEKVLKIVEEAAARTNGQPQSLDINPVPNPPPREPTRPPYYDTVGGLHGIHYRSEFIRLEPGAVYRFSVDARSLCGGAPMVFVKGFFDQRHKTENGEMVLKRNAYRAEMTLTGCCAEWRRFARIIHPAKSKSTVDGKPVQPQWLRVELYAYWPVGVYEFDNVRLDIVGYEAIEAPAPPPTLPRKENAGPPLKEDEFPTFGK